MTIRLILLDRDGVLNHNRADFVKSVKELIVYDEAIEALARIKKRKMPVAVVTNQSCVDKKIISEKMLHEIHAALSKAIEKKGGKIDRFYFAPDEVNHTTINRKPNPGMILQAMEHFDVTATETAMVGDSLVDMEAAARAGINLRVLVKTGHGKKAAIDPELRYCRPVYIAENVLDAVNFILKAQV